MCWKVKCVVKFLECVEKFLECVEKLHPYLIEEYEENILGHWVDFLNVLSAVQSNLSITSFLFNE
jgi:hypothetical protein